MIGWLFECALEAGGIHPTQLCQPGWVEYANRGLAPGG